MTNKGYRVFFSRISLEDKLGAEYEPYIFAALNSARIMLAFGTNYDYYNAVWVKNEWSRFIKLMAKDKSKHLIPCYKDIDAYDMPQEFAHLQAQNMGKVGAVQDLLRGIEKLLPLSDGESKTTSAQMDEEALREAIVSAVAANSCSNISSLLKRGYMALEDKEWDRADGFFEEVLNQDAECAEAYWGKYLAEKKSINTSALKNVLQDEYKGYQYTEQLEACEVDEERIKTAVSEYVLPGYLSENEIRELYRFNRNYNSGVQRRIKLKNEQLNEIKTNKQFAKAKKYADGKLKEEIDSVMTYITNVLDEQIKKEKEKAKKNKENTIEKYKVFLDKADVKVKELRRKADESKMAYYKSLIAEKNKAITTAQYEKVKAKFDELGEYLEAVQNSGECSDKIKELNLEKERKQKEKERLEEEKRQQEEAERIAREEEAKRRAKRNKIIAYTIVAVVTSAIAAVLIITKVVIPNNKYNDAVALMSEGKYQEAISAFEAMNGYKDSNDKLSIAKKNAIYNCSVGEVVYLGDYNGNTEWIVLEKQDNKVFLISQYAIEERPYNTKRESITWEKCILRSWLNSTYINAAFNDVEKKAIISTTISNPNSKYGTAGGNNTNDKVFLLSIDEVKKYFKLDSDRKTTFKEGSSCWWWLRLPGDDDYDAAYVNDFGSVNEFGDYVNNENGAVRPALWVDISNLKS